MNPVEIEEAISQLAEMPLEKVGFPFSFLEAVANKAASVRWRK